MDREELRRSLRAILGEGADLPAELSPDVQAVLEALLQKCGEEAVQRRAAEDMLAFFKASADAMPNPIFIKDDTLHYVFFNRAYREFFGLSEGEHIGKQVFDLDYLTQEERERYHAEDMEMLGALSVIQHEIPFRGPDGAEAESLYWSKGFPVEGTEKRGVVGEIVDISAQKKVQRELARSMRTLELLMRDAEDASKTDPLTKLYNRSVLENDVPAVIGSAADMGQPVCLLLIDVDYFKQINDGHGHPVGDEMLRNVALAIKKSFRERDIAIRYGGDEFMLLLPGARIEQARPAAERMRKAVRESCVLPDGKHVTLSIGLARRREDDNLQTLIARADEALYTAKKAGRNCIAVRE